VLKERLGFPQSKSKIAVEKISVFCKLVVDLASENKMDGALSA